MNSQDYIEVSIKIEDFSEERAELVEAMVADLPYDSFVIENPYLKCYIQKQLYNQMELKAVLAGFDFEASFTATLMPSVNWNKQWESNLEPIIVEGKVTIFSPDSPASRKTRFNIRLRPEMAFGTGYHETTYMMVRGILRNESMIRGAVVLDMGCGTGILGILAAKMGAKRVNAIDIDKVAAQSAFNNAYLNRVSRHLETYCGDASLIQSGKYNVLFANIHRNIILEDMKTYAGALKHGGLLLTSGYYVDDTTGHGDSSEIIAEASKWGLCMTYSDTRDGWACIEFKKA
jgi:ribosomal protein L11 methyltransferase